MIAAEQLPDAQHHHQDTALLRAVKRCDSTAALEEVMLSNDALVRKIMNET